MTLPEHTRPHSVSRIVRTASFYPLSVLYVAVVVVLAGAIQGYVGFVEGALILLVCTMLALMASMRREVIAMSVTLSEQRAALIERIDALAEALADAGYRVPPAEPLEEEARMMAAMEDPEETALGIPCPAVRAETPET